MPDPMAGIWQALVDAEIVPADGDLDRAHAAAAGDLLPALAAIWQKPADGQVGGRQKRRAKSTARWLDLQYHAGAEVTLGIPGISPDVFQRWLGSRIAWWSSGRPLERRVGLVSSRLDRSLDCHDIWFAMLRAACAKVDSMHERLVTATSTSLARFVARSAELFELPLLTIETPRDDRLPLGRWFGRLERTAGSGQARKRCHLYLSPPVIGENCQRGGLAVALTPPRDRALVVLSDRLLVFRVRPEGHVHQLLRMRLQDPVWPPASVFIAIGPDLVAADVASELLDLGAVGWLVPDLWSARAPAGVQRAALPVTDNPAAQTGLPRPVTRPAPIVPLPDRQQWHFLTHCTRGPAGPWPDQTDVDHLDDLILSRPAARHRPMDALCRIVETRRLIATGRAIRGGARVVSFTAVPLADLDRLRVFRPHRGRWDFEPYGIAIEQRWLRQCGARPVCYGDEALWSRLPAEDRPFFQCRESQGQCDTVDWSAEREWRHPGDVDLGRLPAAAAVLFVPSQDEAEALAQISPWPVTLVGNT